MGYVESHFELDMDGFSIGFGLFEIVVGMPSFLNLGFPTEWASDELLGDDAPEDPVFLFDGF